MTLQLLVGGGRWVASASFGCRQLGDLLSPLCIQSTGRKKDGPHYVVACENKQLHRFSSTLWVCSTKGGEAYWINSFSYSLPTSQVKLLSNRSLSPSVALKETMRDAECFEIHTGK